MDSSTQTQTVMKTINRFLGLVLTLVSTLATAQNLHSTSTGETNFFSKTPVENITATNKKVQSILNTTTGEVVVRMNMKQFDFPNKLMGEHFNESYIESEKYPTGTFKGKINEKIDFAKDGIYDVTSDGQFTIHGITKDRQLKGKLTVLNNVISLVSEFEVALVDHKIDVPKLVFVKIAQIVSVKNKFVYALMNK